jgi:hypothetical protein
MITADQFRQQLAARVNEVLPAGFKARPMGDGIWLDAPDGYDMTQWAGHMDEDPLDLELYCEAGIRVLDGFQDCVAMTLREFWPMAASEPEHRMAMPGGKIEGTVLRLWYGDAASPVVSLGEIDLGA